MTPFSKILAVDIFVMFIALILYVIFGQITVRKLRKNPETKHRLGLELASGLDILNVAQALSLPRSITRIFARGPLSALHADAEVLSKNTTKLDRYMARTVYWLLMTTAILLFALIIVDAISQPT